MCGVGLPFLDSFVEETVLSPWDALGVLVKGQLAASKDFISGPCFCLLSQCAVLYWSLEIWKCESSSIALFKDCFGYSGSFVVSFEFLNQCFDFYRTIWDPDRTALDLATSLSNHAI